MIVLTCAALCAFLMASLRPDTPGRRLLHEWLVEAPARVLNRGWLVALASIIATGMMAGLAVAAPEMIAIFGAVDLALMVEVSVLVMLTSGVSRIRHVLSVLASAPRRAARGLRRVVATAHGRARRPVRPPRSPANDADADPEAWRLAA